MKKFFLLFFGLLFFTVPMFAQDIGELLKDLLGENVEYFYSLGALSGAVIAVTAAINLYFKWHDSPKRWLSWVVALGLGLIGYFIKIGIFEDVTWYLALAYAFYAAMAANGFFKAFLSTPKKE